MYCYVFVIVFDICLKCVRFLDVFGCVSIFICVNILFLEHAVEVGRVLRCAWMS